MAQPRQQPTTSEANDVRSFEAGGQFPNLGFCLFCEGSHRKSRCKGTSELSDGLPRKRPTPTKMKSSRATTTAPEEKPRVRKIGSLVNQLISRRGYAQVAVVNEIQDAVIALIDQQIRSSVRIGNLKRGVLEIYASDSVTLQELNFQKRTILKKLQKTLPQSNVTGLKFRIQAN